MRSSLRLRVVQDAAACNYDASATDDDGSCAELDDCGVCGGSVSLRETATATECSG